MIRFCYGPQQLIIMYTHICVILYHSIRGAVELENYDKEIFMKNFPSSPNSIINLEFKKIFYRKQRQNGWVLFWTIRKFANTHSHLKQTYTLTNKFKIVSCRERDRVFIRWDWKLYKKYLIEIFEYHLSLKPNYQKIYIMWSRQLLDLYQSLEGSDYAPSSMISRN